MKEIEKELKKQHAPKRLEIKSVRLDEELAREIEQTAKRLKVSEGEVIRTAIRIGLGKK